jgi:glycosyltransferase involved in cell wall biosynthesis
MPIAFLADSWEPGLRAAPFKYPRQLLRTYRRLLQDRPRVVFVQSPPSLAVWAVAVYAALRGALFVIDAHSDAFQRGRWTRPRWLNRLVARRAAATLVTDPYWAEMLRGWGAEAVVIPDVPSEYSVGATPSGRIDTEAFMVAFVNTWADDEPLDAVLAAAQRLPQVAFVVTGRTKGHESIIRDAPPNVDFVGYLPDPAYYELLGRASGVMCLTTRDHTMQRGACEALSLGRPIITSDWPLLRSYFVQGTLHVDNTADGIERAITTLMKEHNRLVREVEVLRDSRRSEWKERREALKNLLEETIA